MKTKTKKIILICIISIIFISLASFFMFSADYCGCADSYMGASFVYSVCTFVDDPITGEPIMKFRRCVYEY